MRCTLSNNVYIIWEHFKSNYINQVITDDSDDEFDEDDEDAEMGEDKEDVDIVKSANQEYELLLEYIGYEIGRTYSTIFTPNLWFKLLAKANPEVKETLMKIPVVWPEEIIQQNTTS